VKSENRNLKYYFLLAIFIFLLSLAAFFSNLFVVQSQTFYATANVTSGYVGFDVNSTDLIFGNVAKPGTSTRNIIFESGYSFPVLVLISVNGSIEICESWKRGDKENSLYGCS
jgi:hypothetical protein